MTDNQVLEIINLCQANALTPKGKIGKELLPEVREMLSAPAQGVEEAADDVIRNIYNRHAAINGDTEPDPFGDLLKGTGKADKQVLSFVRELFTAGSRWQQGQGNVKCQYCGQMYHGEEPTHSTAPTIGARWVRASMFKDVGVNSPKYDDADRILILFPYDNMWRFGIGSHDDGKWYYDNDYEVEQETVNQMYYLSESPATFPTREQAEKWVSDEYDESVIGNYRRRAALAMYDWVVQQLNPHP